MEVNQEAPVEQSTEASGEAVKKDQVAYETYLKVLSEKKNLQQKISKLTEYEQRIKELEEAKLSAEGKKDELIEQYKKRFQEQEEALKKTKQTYAWNTVTSEIKRAAAMKGCKDPDKLLRLINDEDLNMIEVDDSFNINKNVLDEILEKQAKENYFLFETNTKQVAPGMPSKSSPEVSIKDRLKKMSLEELKEAIKTGKY